MKINIELAGGRLDGRVQLRAIIPLAYELISQYDRDFEWSGYGPTQDGGGSMITSPYFKTAREGRNWIEAIKRLVAQCKPTSEERIAAWGPLLGSHEVD